VRRALYWAIPALAALAVAPTVAGDKVDGPDKKKPLPGRVVKPDPVYFDVDRFFEEYDRNKDGFLTRDELPERLRANFDKIDANKDGKLSKDELRKNSTWLHPRRRPSDMVYVLIEMSDCDVGCTEEVQRVYDVLRKLDANKDGKIDAGELKAMRLAIVRERVDYLIKELDADKDGKISKAEARGEIRHDFDHLDRNKDGYIDRDELLHAALARHPPRPGKKPSEGPEGK
jgi:Ca2+-binding EF-hand superfamily protein